MKLLNILTFCILFLSCGGGSGKTVTETKPAFRTPPVPSYIKDPQSANIYIAENYWKNFNFADTSYLNMDATEQYFADYIYLLNSVPAKTSESSMADFMKSVSVNGEVYNHFTELLEKYLYDPSSPARNEELYIVVLEDMVSTELLDGDEKIRPTYQLRMATKNRVGQPSADITIKLKDGSVKNIYSIKADYTLIYFNNPDCSACAALTEDLQRSGMINPLINRGVVQVFAVYPDEDVVLWNAHASEIPVNWISGYDYGLDIRKENTYDLRAIPSLYLLDKDKKVILKDVDRVQLLDRYFYEAGY